ncbi:MAG TPA: glycosyltransferase [Ktedonobacteraceae bacterium]|nr:glycosyltransferase [Ktedonobacteraceae bacterium]
MTQRIALYWHNGRSLGHTVRSATLGQALLQTMPGCAVAGMTGASRGLELLPAGMDVVKLPSYLAFDNQQGATFAPVLPIEQEQFYRIRASLVEAFIREYQPHVFLVDYYPQGKAGELIPAITGAWQTRNVLGLRGILGTPEETNSQVFHREMERFLLAHYAAIHVYIDERVFCLEEYYDVPRSLRSLITYTGYVTRSGAIAKEDARAQLGVERGARVVVASFGGGQGTEALWQALLNGLERIAPRFDLAYFAAGPYLEDAAYERLQRRIALHPDWTWTRLLDPLPTLMAASDLFIGSGGYNTLAEVMAVNANALIVPRQLQEREQALHAARLAKLGIVRVAELETMLQSDSSALLEMCLREPYPAGNMRIATDGARRNAQLMGLLM